MNKYITAFITLLIFAFSAFAQEVGVEPLPGESIVDAILNFISSPAVATVLSLGVVDILCRIFKTEKPIGVMHFLAGMLKMLGNLFSKLGEFLDKLVGQRTNKNSFR